MTPPEPPLAACQLARPGSDGEHSRIMFIIESYFDVFTMYFIMYQ